MMKKLIAYSIPEKELLERVKQTVLALSPKAEIVLYGSRARGNALPDSDWDFLILLPLTADESLEAQIKDCLYELELETDTVISSIIRSKPEWESAQYKVLPLRQQIEKDGIAV